MDRILLGVHIVGQMCTHGACELHTLATEMHRLSLVPRPPLALLFLVYFRECGEGLGTRLA